MKAQQDAIRQVVPDFDNDPAAESDTVVLEDGREIILFPAKKDSILMGVAVQTVTNKGFSGEIKLMVGMKPDGTILNYQVLEHKETPGLGSKMNDWFRPSQQSNTNTTDNQSSVFKDLYGIKSSGGNNRSVIGKNPGTNKLTVKKDGGEIDAITAATISSRAFLDAISSAYIAYTQKTQPDAVSGATHTNHEEGGEHE